MAERLAYLEAVIGADITQFRRGMRDVRNEVGFLSETVNGLTGLGRNLTYTLTTPLVALGSAALNAASEFQASMYNINAIAGLSANELEALSQRALEFGANTRSGAQAAAEALYTVFSAGLTNVEQAFSAMEVATYTAEAGLADLTTTTEAMLSVMLSYGDTSEEMAWKVSDAMTQMVAVGVGSMQEFATALGNVVPTAQALGMDINQLMGDMAFLTQRGLSAAKAGTALNSALTALIKPSEAMSAAMQDLGANSAQELITQFGGVNEALMALIGHADGSQEALAAMFGNIRGLRAINLFAGDVEGWADSMAEFYESLDGATLRAWEQQMSSFSASWDRLKSAVEGAGIAIGTQMFPVLQPIINGLTEFVLQVTRANPEILAMGVAFTAVAAAIPPILWLLGSLITPFGVIIGAVTALGVAFSSNFMGMRDIVQSATSGILASLEPLGAGIQEFWDTIFPEEMDITPPTMSGTIPTVQDMVNINPPSGAVSLWDFYEGEGYIESMSWDEFMLLATEGGWEGGAITPDNPLTFAIGETPIDTSFHDNLAELNMEIDAQAQEIPQTFGERFQTAMAALAPKISQTVSTLFSGAVSWFDGVGGGMLRGITRAINSIDEDAIYAAFQAILTGDWGFITDSLGLSGDDIADTLAGWRTRIEEALPNITEGLKSLLENAGIWLLDEGIPLLARSFGFLAGRIGVMLYDAIQAGINFFTSGGAGGAANAIAGYVDESIVTPFAEGMGDATAGSSLALDFSSFTTTIETALADTFEGLSVETIMESMGTKLTEMVTWLTDTGIPLMSGGLGTFAGNLAVVLNDAIAAGLSYIFGGGAATDAGSVTDYAQNSVIAPFTEGFEAAIAGTDFETGMTTLMTNLTTFGEDISNVADLLQIDAAFNGLKDLGDGIIGFFTAFENVDMQELSNMLVFFAMIGGGIFRAAMDILDGLGTGLGAALTNLGDGFASLINAFVDLSRGDISGALGEIAQGIWSIALAIGNVAVGVLEGVYNAIASIFNLDVPDFRELWEGVFSSMSDHQTEVPVGYVWVDTTPTEDNPFGGYWAEEGALEIPVVPVLDDDAPPIIFDTANADAQGSQSPAMGDFTPTQLPNANPPPAEETGTFVEGVTSQEESPITIPALIEPTGMDLTGVSSGFAEDFAAGADFQTIIDDQFIPLEEAWVALFAQEGLMATTFALFAANIAQGWMDMDIAAAGFIGTINEDLPTAQTTIATFAEAITASLGVVSENLADAAGEARTLIDKIAELVALETEVSVDVTVSSDSVDGSHARGLPSVPYDGYVAELHKNERVLTAAEAKAYNAGDNLQASNHAMNGGIAATQDTYNDTEVHVHGVQDIDKMLFELKRRGYKLAK